MTRKRREEPGSDSAFDYDEGAMFSCLPVLAGALALLVVGVVLMLAALA